MGFLSKSKKNKETKNSKKEETVNIAVQLEQIQTSLTHISKKCQDMATVKHTDMLNTELVNLVSTLNVFSRQIDEVKQVQTATTKKINDLTDLVNKVYSKLVDNSYKKTSSYIPGQRKIDDIVLGKNTMPTTLDKAYVSKQILGNFFDTPSESDYYCNLGMPQILNWKFFQDQCQKQNITYRFHNVTVTRTKSNPFEIDLDEENVEHLTKEIMIKQPTGLKHLDRTAKALAIALINRDYIEYNFECIPNRDLADKLGIGVTSWSYILKLANIRMDSSKIHKLTDTGVYVASKERLCSLLSNYASAAIVEQLDYICSNPNNLSLSEMASSFNIPKQFFNECCLYWCRIHNRSTNFKKA